MKKERCTKEQYDRRVFTVQGWIIDGVSEFLIRKQAVAQWSICSRTAKRYIKDAFDGIRPDLARTIVEKCEGKIAELEHRKRSLGEKFRNTPEGIRTLNDIDKMIIRLQGIEPPKQIVLQGDKDKPIVYSSAEERDAKIAELIAKATNYKS